MKKKHRRKNNKMVVQFVNTIPVDQREVARITTVTIVGRRVVTIQPEDEIFSLRTSVDSAPIKKDKKMFSHQYS